MGGTHSAEHPIVDLYVRGMLNQQSLRTALNQRNTRVDINGTGRKGEATITFAAQCGDLNTVRLLTQFNANIILPSSRILYTRSPFHLALANKHEPLALYLFTSSDLVRGSMYIQDGLGKSPIMIAAQKQLHYLLWVMCVHTHGFTAYPSRVLTDNYTQWVDLTFTHYITTMRKALDEASGELQIPLLFGAFGLPSTVYVSADRHNYDFHTHTTQNFHGMYPHTTKYMDPITSGPLLSASPTSCPQCTSATCKDNDCVLLCYLSHLHQFSDFLQNQHQLIANQTPDQFNPANHPPEIHQQLQNMVITELRKFTSLTNQKAEQHDNATYHLSNAHLIVPSIVLPPPILLSASLQRSYTCTRSKCICAKPPQQPNQPPVPHMCCIYPPLISIPTYPLSFLNPGGYHKSVCQTIQIDKQQKTTSITNVNESIMKSKSNVHSTDIIQMHKAYISHIRKIYSISHDMKTLQRRDTTTSITTSTTSPSSPTRTPSTSSTSATSRVAQDAECPGFSVPTDYVLARYCDATTPPKATPSKTLSEKMGGLWSNIRDIAAVVTNTNPRFADGTVPASLDDFEPVIINNIRYHSNHLAISNRFTLSIVGPKRDLITPLRFTEQPTNTAFTSMYPPNFPQTKFYEQAPPILSNSYTTTPQLQNPTPVEIETVVKSFLRDRARLSPAPPTLYPPIATSYVTASADLTQSFTNLRPQSQLEADFQSTCLCGAHTTAIEPVRLKPSTACLNIDGRSVRITDYSKSHAFRDMDEKPKLDHSLFAAFTPQTSIIYRPSPAGLSANATLFDFGLPYHDAFQDICPPLAPSHDLSSQSNNKNHHHDPAVKNNTKAICALGALSSGGGSIKAQMDLHDLGSVIISPSHNISIVIPVPHRSIVLLTCGLQRVLQAKFPHYLLYSQWTHFTTRIASAIGRISQRRLNQRLHFAEINILNIYHADLTNVVNLYKLHYFAYLNAKSQNPDPTQRLETSQQLQLLRRQVEMYETYLGLIEQYLILRTYRLSTSQFTPGSNILALLGNVVNTAEHDVEFYGATNKDQATLANTSFTNRHSGTNSDLFSSIPITTVEAMLTSKHQQGGGILTSLPTPLPPHYNPTLSNFSPLSPPENTITLDSAQDRFRREKQGIQKQYGDAIAAFAADYPQLAQVPNKSVLNEVQQFYERKRAWDTRNNPQPSTTTTTTTTTSSPKPTRPPFALQQPYSIPEDTMVNDLVSICGYIIASFQQRIRSAIDSINTNISSDRPNPHKINYHESLAILQNIQSQATLLNAWLQLGDVHPHYHSQIHIPVMRDDLQQFQPPEHLSILSQQSYYPQSPQPTTQFNNFGTRPASVSNTPPVTSYGNYDTIDNTHYPNKPSNTVDPTDAPPQYDTDIFEHNPPRSNAAPVGVFQPTPLLKHPIKPITEDIFYDAPPPEAPPDYHYSSDPTYNHHHQQQQHPSQTPTSFRYDYGDDVGIMTPRDYTLYQSRQSASPTPHTHTFFESDNSSSPQEAHKPGLYPTIPAQQQQQQQLAQPPLTLTNSGDMTGFFDDGDFPMPNAAKQPQNQTPAPTVARRSSVTESNDYFLSLVREEPAIVLALDDEYIDKLASNGEVLIFLKTKHPNIWSQLTVNYPRVVSLLDQYQNNRIAFA